jgi:Ca2+-binding EF-hand superfamily protein
VNIDNDDYFELMIRNAWHISGGSGWCENSSNLRVKVTMPDGSERVVEVENDLGIKADDYHKIRKMLKDQGINAVGIDTKGAVEEDEKKKAALVDDPNNKSARNANLSLGAVFKNKNKKLDAASRPVASGKSGVSAFGEVKGASVMDALNGTGMSSSKGDKKRTTAGEADHGVTMVLKALKRQIKKRGGNGMIGLSRKFKIMDDSGDGELQFSEFKKAMKEMEFDMNDKDLTQIFRHFDADGGGTVSYEEFIQGIRDPLNERRKDLIRQAFKQIDKDGSGVIEAHEVAGAYDASKHPEVMSGRKTEKQVLEEFLSTFDVGGVVDGAVTEQEFMNYYHNISANIFNEDYFELMIRNAWHISGGKGAAANR